VVTPLAVLQNWHNEIKRFTPNLSGAGPCAKDRLALGI
jgi:SNF2 family DNA or RNA helicase